MPRTTIPKHDINLIPVPSSEFLQEDPAENDTRTRSSLHRLRDSSQIMQTLSNIEMTTFNDDTTEQKEILPKIWLG